MGRKAAPAPSLAMTPGEYEAAVSRIWLPDSVIATKLSSDSGEWHIGDRRDVRHHCWQIQTADTTKQKVTPFIISLDAFVDVGGIRLSDVSLLADAVTARTLLVTALQSGFAGKGGVTDRTAYQQFSSFCWLIRWRLSDGLLRMSHMTKQYFDDYVERLHAGDILLLVPISERLDRLVERARAADYTLKLRKRRGPPSPDYEALARELGVTAHSLLFSPLFMSKLGDCCSVLAPGTDLILDPGSKKTKKRPEREAIDGKGVSARFYERALGSWEALSVLTRRRRLAHDPLLFKPFADCSFGKMTRSLGFSRRRTLTLPPPDFLRLLDCAATWVLDYGPHIMAAVKQRMALPQWPINKKKITETYRAELPPGMPNLSLLISKKTEDQLNDGTITIGLAVKYLYVAAAILIAAFAARRVGEVSSLTAKCIVEKRPGIYNLSCYIEKTLRDMDEVPVPAMVNVVVNILKDISADARNKSGNAWIFASRRRGDGPNVKYWETSWETYLNQFAQFNGLPVPKGWTEWRLTPQQLRRGFAVCYHYGFELASLAALSHFLRHYSLEMTRVYVLVEIPGRMAKLGEEIAARSTIYRKTMTADERRWLKDARKLLLDLKSRADDFDEVRCEAVAHQLLEAWNGADVPIGFGGAGLMRTMDKLYEDVEAATMIGSRLNDSSDVQLSFFEQVKIASKDIRIDPVPGGFSRCTFRAGHDQPEEAECLKFKSTAQRPWSKSEDGAQDQAPDFAYADENICLKCVYGAAFCSEQGVIENRIASAGLAARRVPTVKGRKEAERLRVQLAENLLNAAKAGKGHGQ